MIARNWTIYNLESGIFLPGRVTCAEGAVNVPEGCAALEGLYDPLSQAVDIDTRRVVDVVPPAPADTDLQTWTWDAALRRHVATPTLLARKQQRAQPVQAAIEAIEAQQSPRPMREALVELFAGRQVPAETKARLVEISTAIAPLRSKLQAIAAASTQQELDAIP